MVSTPRERMLLLVICLAILGGGGTYAGRWLYEAWTGIDDEIQSQKKYLAGYESYLDRSEGIKQEFAKTQDQLTMNMHDSAKLSEFSRELDALLKDAGLSYQELRPQEKFRYLEDFKVLLAEISQAEGTPQQLGAFLYNLEHRSNVLDVEEITITNDTGRRGRSRSDSNLLSIDMTVARLVEYATDEERPDLSRRGRLGLRR